MTVHENRNIGQHGLNKVQGSTSVVTMVIAVVEIPSLPAGKTLLEQEKVEVKVSQKRIKAENNVSIAFDIISVCTESPACQS
ncbi:hypothetical protein QYF36_016324 [Acer negundo]|nr:hypothetical protein QYF36_016324 [Acer negundo]